MNKLIEEIKEDANNASIDKPFAVGAFNGICYGISLVIGLMLLGAVIPVEWRWAFPSKTTAHAVDGTPKLQAPFEVETIYRDVPFIPLSDDAVRYGLINPSKKAVIEREMLSRSYFEAESLKGGAKYIPKLRDLSNVRSVVMLTNSEMSMIVVQLVTDDGSPGRYGLISLEEYEDDIRSLGK